MRRSEWRGPSRLRPCTMARADRLCRVRRANTCLDHRKIETKDRTAIGASGAALALGATDRPIAMEDSTDQAHGASASDQAREFWARSVGPALRRRTDRRHRGRGPMPHPMTVRGQTGSGERGRMCRSLDYSEKIPASAKQDFLSRRTRRRVPEWLWSAEGL